MGLWSGQSEVSEKYWPVRKASGERLAAAAGTGGGDGGSVWFVSCAGRRRRVSIIPLRKYDFARCGWVGVQDKASEGSSRRRQHEQTLGEKLKVQQQWRFKKKIWNHKSTFLLKFETAMIPWCHPQDKMSLVSVCSNLQVCLQPAQRRSLSGAALFKKKRLSLLTPFYTSLPTPILSFLTILLETPKKLVCGFRLLLLFLQGGWVQGRTLLCLALLCCFDFVFLGGYLQFFMVERKRIASRFSERRFSQTRSSADNCCLSISAPQVRTMKCQEKIYRFPRTFSPKNCWTYSTCLTGKEPVENI